MDGEALRRGSHESPTGRKVVRVEERGSRTDRLRVGSEAQRDHSDDPVPPQGQRDGGTQGPDHQAPQGQRRFASPSGGPGPKDGGGRGASSSSGGGANPGRGREREVARRLLEVFRLRGVCWRRADQGPALRPVYEETGSRIHAEGTLHAGRLQWEGGEPIEGAPVITPT